MHDDMAAAFITPIATDTQAAEEQKNNSADSAAPVCDFVLEDPSLVQQ